MTLTPEAIVDHFKTTAEVASGLIVPGHELHSVINDGVQEIGFPLDILEDIHPGEEPGTFVMRFTTELIENRGKIVFVTGAAVLACTSLIAQRRRTHSLED